MNVLALVDFVVIGSIISSLGPAIPLIVRGNIGVWAACKKSMQLKQWLRGALFLLIVESVVGSSLAGYATYHVLSLLMPVQRTLWFGWLVYGVAVLVGAAMRPHFYRLLSPRGSGTA